MMKHVCMHTYTHTYSPVRKSLVTLPGISPATVL